MFAILSLLFLASQALAFNITLGAQVFQTAEVVNFTFSEPLQGCAQQCVDTQQALNDCAEDAACICNNSTASMILTCQECLFTALITANKPMPDPRAGSNPLMGAYSASCALANVNLTAAQTALTLPSNWDGPVGIALNMGTTVLVTIIGTAMVGGSIFILSTM